MKKYIFLILLFSSPFNLPAQSGDTIRLCVWNLQTYGSQESGERNLSIVRVLDEIAPDIFVLQGILKDTTQQLLHQVVETLSSSSAYSRVPQELTQPSIEYRESHIYFNTAKFRWLESISFTTNRHENLLCRLLHETTGDTLNIFAVSLHPLSPVEREMQIADITGPLRNQYAHFLKTAIVGSMYFYAPEESAYQRLTAKHNNAPWFLHVTDPFGKDWQENTAEFSSLYTNSTRSHDTGCDTALGNGLKYRYEYILNRSELLENYIPNSSIVFGNDGTDRRNSSVAKPPNQAVSQEIAEALQCASSHLPVYADYVFGKTTTVNEVDPEAFNLSLSPNLVKDQMLMTYTLSQEVTVEVTIINNEGLDIQTIFKGIGLSGVNRVEWNTKMLAQGAYFIRFRSGNQQVIQPFSFIK